MIIAVTEGRVGVDHAYMTLDLSSRLGLLGVVLALFSIAAFYMWPDKKWIGWMCLIFAGGLVLAWGVIEVKEKIENQAISLVVSVIGGCIVGGLLAALIWNSYRGVQAESDAGGVQLSVTCDTVGLPMLYTGDLWILDTVMFSGLGRLSSSHEVPWPEDGVKGLGYRCTVKNYGTSPAFGVSLSLEVTVFNWIKTGPASWGDGDPKGKHTEAIVIPRPLGPQGGDEFSFYICSYDPDSSLSVSIPAVAWVNSDDPQKRREAPLRVSSLTGKNTIEVPAKMLATRHPRSVLVPTAPPSIPVPSDLLNMSETRAALIGKTLRDADEKGIVRIVSIGDARPDLVEQLRSQFVAGGWKVDPMDIGVGIISGSNPSEPLYILSPHSDSNLTATAINALAAAHITIPVHPGIPTIGPLSAGIPDVTIVVQQGTRQP
jgi:hypothetical protein